LLWELTEAKAFDVDVLKQLAVDFSRRLKPVSLSEPVVAFDQELRATDDLIELSDAVELQPDDWPAYAGRPFAQRDLVMADASLVSLLAKGSET
jgi:hypothetical protein